MGSGEMNEVRFYNRTKPRPIRGVEVLEVSSELSQGHNRRAEFLLDSSGLEPVAVGWNRQGHPFYAAGVAYVQKFNVTDPKGEYFVALGNWYGSVSKVVVNGQPAGYVAYPPWKCDVTDRIKPGENTIDVEVIGTLKNTLGPHHAGELRGAAGRAALMARARTTAIIGSAQPRGKAQGSGRRGRRAPISAILCPVVNPGDR